MDAPKGRYRVEEKDGRLTVIDTLAAASETSATPPPGTGAAQRPGPGAASGPPGLLDRYGRLLLGLAVKSWTPDGRAVMTWEWERNGRTQRWDAMLGAAEQKRLGRALAGISAFPAFVLGSILAGPASLWWLLPPVLASVFWGVWAITRLQRETGARP